MNDYMLMLLAKERAAAYRREADDRRLAALARRSNDRIREGHAPTARRFAIRGVVRRLSLLVRLVSTRGRTTPTSSPS